MQEYVQVFLDGYYGYWNYLSSEILYPSWHNYFWWLLGISLVVWSLELVFPWRKNQAAIREDFWLDGFYMFFNFFLFSLIGYNAVSNVAVEAFNDFLALFGINNLVAFQIASWPVWSQFLLLFVVADFIQWNVHRWLHYSPLLWEFHKVHHSVEQMGFAAHLRYHWMETIIYKSVQYIPLSMIGVNYGISLSLWDYLFGTAYIPNQNANEPLGFEDQESFPKTFLQQLTHPWNKK
jgi:sterol desaturase/sphingolipid hydroxylase (fatty acid hydroxylase superfamily)